MVRLLLKSTCGGGEASGGECAIMKVGVMLEKALVEGRVERAGAGPYATQA